MNFVVCGTSCTVQLCVVRRVPPGGCESIIRVEDYVDNSLTSLGSCDPREVRL